jgi:hypothetical protein
MPASDSSIRSEGAELLVQAILMLEYGVITSRASRNMPGYDLIAHNLEGKKDCKISVKYRKALDCDGFQFTRVDDFDFFVGVFGRRGKVGKQSTAQDSLAEMLSQAYVLSLDEVAPHVRKKGNKLLLPRQNVVREEWKGAWSKILSFLDFGQVATSASTLAGFSHNPKPSGQRRLRVVAAEPELNDGPATTRPSQPVA